MMLTLAEVAEHLKVTERFLREEIYRGNLKAMKVGAGRHAAYRISVKDRDDYIRRSTVKPKARAS